MSEYPLLCMNSIVLKTKYNLTFFTIVGIPEKLLLSFSIITNVQKIFAASEKTDRFAVLHGIKFLSMSWIILGHSFLFVYHYAGRSSVMSTSALSTMSYVFFSK